MPEKKYLPLTFVDYPDIMPGPPLAPDQEAKNKELYEQIRKMVQESGIEVIINGKKLKDLWEGSH